MRTQAQINVGAEKRETLNSRVLNIGAFITLSEHAPEGCQHLISAIASLASQTLYLLMPAPTKGLVTHAYTFGAPGML